MASQFSFRSVFRATGETMDQISDNIHEITTRVFATRLGFASLLEELRIWVLPFERFWNHVMPNTPKTRSVVRILSTFVPVPAARRVHIKILDDLMNVNQIYAIDIFNQDNRCLDDDNSIMRERLSSTPIDANILMSPVSVANPKAEMRIAHLEDELKELRTQIASILASKDAYRCDNAMVQSHARLPTLPPPPPPPLPSKLLSNCTVPTKLSVTCQSGNRRHKEHELPNLKEILKDIGNVRLRKTERSPGGTPFKPKNKRDSVCNDAASILASALKKRYLHLHSFSPDQSLEQISEHSWSDTWQSSPTKQKLLL